MNNWNASELWTRIVETIGPEIGKDNVELWLRPVEAASLEDHLMRITVPNRFYTEWIKDRCQQRIEAALKALTGKEMALDYSVARDLKGLLPDAEPTPEARPHSEFTLSELHPRYTFSSFVVGASNRFAHATAEAIAKNPGRQFNPFFLYGGVGLGKTHLMHAVGHALRRAYAHARVIYTTSETFVNEYINSIRDKNTDEFRAKYRNLDCLLVDDIQFLIAKEASEQEFFHTFNSLFDARKQVIISSDRSPKEMAPLEQRLISRFEWGVVADIKPPDLETRIAILRKKAESEKVFVPDDVILFVASAIKANIRQLEGALIRLSAFSSLTGSPLSVDVAKELLKDSVGVESGAMVRVETIQKLVAEQYSLEVRDLKSRSRTSEVAFPRQLAMYLSLSLTDSSTTDVGKSFGGRDHTTVIHGRDKIKKMLENDPFFLETVNRLIEKIKTVDNS
ncbi:MAG: chromosomal replication initiator protein DnaA [Elusimicrobiota bacterium]